MPFDAPRQHGADAATRQGASLLYVLSADASAGMEAEGLVSAEVAGLRSLGTRVVPFMLNDAAFRLDPALAGEAMTTVGTPSPGLSTTARSPIALARATRLAMAQRSLPAAQAMRMGARVAAAAREHGCSGIHAIASDDAATAALIGGRLAGMPVSIAGRGGEVYAKADDLALKLRAADIAIAACAEMAEDFRSLAPRATVRAVDRGIDAEWFRPGPGLERNGRILCLSPLVPRSGISTMLAALAHLPKEFRPVVDIIGAGPLLEVLRAEALERGISDHARFLGTRGRRWVAEEGQRYLGLVAPGIVAPDGDRDPAPVAVLQAMALELPVLASAVMGLRQIVQPDSGHLVPPGEASPLARGLHWLSIMPEEHRRRLGRSGRDRILGGYTMADRAVALAQTLTGRAE